VRHEASGGRLSSVGGSQLGRRSVLRAGAGVAAGLLIGGEQRQARAVPVRQTGSFTLGGRWVEADGFRLAQRGDPAQFVVFTADFPFYALAPSWSGEGDPGGSVELLWSADGVTWSEPIWIGRASHSGRPDRDGRTIGSLVSTPGAQFLQYRTYDSAGNFAPLPGFEIDYIDASAGPSLEQVANPALTPVFAPPPLITRAGWGADESLRYGRGGEEIFPVEYQPVEHVIIHHADTANFNDPVLEMRSIYYFHAITRGWGDIAYNYLVDFMGNVYEGRVGGEDAVGCHAEGYNAGSCGICLMGRFFEDPATPEMHNAIVWISSWAARNLDPAGAAPFYDIANLPTICGHRDVNNTSCPGDEFYVQLDTVRAEARRVIRGRDDPEPPPPQWYPGMRVLTNADGVSLRAGPGKDFDVTAKVAIDEPLLVLQGPATNDSTIWYEVQGVSLTGWIAGNLLSPDPNPVPLDPLPAEAPAAAASPDTGTPLPAGEPAPVVEEPVSEADLVDAPVESDETSDELDGGSGVDEERQETWPVFAAGTTTSVSEGPLNLHVEPALWATVLTALPAGYEATVIAGPVEGEGIAWYQVVTPEGVEGWCDGSFLQTL
jgi:N-acetylmuramoyl-L-alanine amidase/Bacterial SH3 domain